MCELFCFRHFVQPDKWLISVTLLHSFDFRQDSLTIFDGGSNTSPMLADPYCGEFLPPSQISSSNHLFIHFHSDLSITGTGFKLEYNATSKNPYKIDNSTIVFVSRLPVMVPIVLYIRYCPLDFSLLDTIFFISSRLC